MSSLELQLIVAMIVGVIAISEVLKRLKRQFIYDPLIKRLNMRPICPGCERPIPQPKPERCEYCGTKFLPKKRA